MNLTVKKYGQITQIWKDDKVIYVSGNSVKSEIKNLKKLFEAMQATVDVVNGDEQ